jgi:TPR repeat protein
MKSTLAAAVFAAFVLCPLAASGEHDTRDPFEQALAAYEIGRYADAVSWLSIAGENNDVRAQQMLGLMYVYGEALYGPELPRNVGLGKAWLYRAEAQGSQVARFAVSRLDKGQPVPPTLAVADRDASGE